jgi:phage N-6-adenine-methyltransferase
VAITYSGRDLFNKMKSHQLINQDSGNFEYYTPIEIVKLARVVMGGIDLDPASSEVANRNIMASQYLTKEDNALNLPWNGRVWMNHPFSRKDNAKWINKLVEEYEKGNVTSACCITFNSTSESWFRPLLNHPQCFIFGRTQYHLPDGTIKRGVTKGSVVTYFGNNPDEFKKQFIKIGAVKI